MPEYKDREPISPKIDLTKRVLCTLDHDNGIMVHHAILQVADEATMLRHAQDSEDIGKPGQWIYAMPRWIPSDNDTEEQIWKITDHPITEYEIETLCIGMNSARMGNGIVPEDFRVETNENRHYIYLRTPVAVFMHDATPEQQALMNEGEG